MLVGGFAVASVGIGAGEEDVDDGSVAVRWYDRTMSNRLYGFVVVVVDVKEVFRSPIVCFGFSIAR